MKSKQTEITGFTKPENGTALHTLPKEKKHPQSCGGAVGSPQESVCAALPSAVGPAWLCPAAVRRRAGRNGWWGPWAGRH